MIKKFKFDYDYENDSLFIYSSKSNASITIADLVIDYNSKKEICAIEILNTSKFLKESKLSKEKLKKLLECNIEIISKNNFLTIKLILILESKEEIFAPILVPSIKEFSPAAII